MKIHGRIALVTGGSRGIGRASVLVLAAAGCDVAVNYVHARDEAESLVREIVSRGQRALAIRGDVSREADVSNLSARSSKPSVASISL
jgi:3-oxoacyl-[acyl-carrier protein] reductase